MKQEVINAVWMKGTTIPEYDSRVWRRDEFGSAIKFSEYGNRESDFGWEIDHIIPLVDGGFNTIGNLRPLQWATNVRRSR